MRTLIVLALVLAVRAVPKIYVVPIIGQSNSVGSNDEGHTDEDVTFPNILQTSCCNNGESDSNNCQLVQGQDPLHHQCDYDFLNGQSVGFGMSFARELRQTIAPDEVIVLVPAGIGATGFVDDVWTAYTGRGFIQALLKIQSTFKLITQKYPEHEVQLAGYLWHQGETDALVNTTVADYLNQDIIPMIRAWRNSTLIPQTNANVPFVVGNLVPEWVEDPNQTQRLGVMTALQVLDQFVPYTMCAPSQGLLRAVSNQIHFSADSQRLFGKRYFASLRVAQLNSKL